jgi:hypothetical protein
MAHRDVSGKWEIFPDCSGHKESLDCYLKGKSKGRETIKHQWEPLLWLVINMELAPNWSTLSTSCSQWLHCTKNMMTQTHILNSQPQQILCPSNNSEPHGTFRWSGSTQENKILCHIFSPSYSYSTLIDINSSYICLPNNSSYSKVISIIRLPTMTFNKRINHDDRLPSSPLVQADYPGMNFSEHPE